jgi:hypothetical protein
MAPLITTVRHSNADNSIRALHCDDLGQHHRGPRSFHPRRPIESPERLSILPIFGVVGSAIAGAGLARPALTFLLAITRRGPEFYCSTSDELTNKVLREPIFSSKP